MFLNDDVLEIVCGFLSFDGSRGHDDDDDERVPPPLWMMLGVSRQCRRCAVGHGLTALGVRRAVAVSGMARTAAGRTDELVLSLVAPQGIAGEHPVTVTVLTDGQRRLHRQFAPGPASMRFGRHPTVEQANKRDVGRWLAFCMRGAEAVAEALTGQVRVQLHCPAAVFTPPWSVVSVLSRALATAAAGAGHHDSGRVVLDALCSPAAFAVGPLANQPLARLFDGAASHAAAVVPRTLCLAGNERLGFALGCLSSLRSPETLTALDLTHVVAPLPTLAEILGRFTALTVLRLFCFQDVPDDTGGLARLVPGPGAAPNVFGPGLRELDLGLASVPCSAVHCLYRHLHETLEVLSLEGAALLPDDTSSDDLLAWPECPMRRLRRLELCASSFLSDAGLMAMLGPRCQLCRGLVDFAWAGSVDVERSCRTLVGVADGATSLVCPSCQNELNASRKHTTTRKPPAPTSLYPALETLGVAICELYSVNALIVWAALSARRARLRQRRRPARQEDLPVAAASPCGRAAPTTIALQLACDDTYFADELPRLEAAVAASNTSLVAAHPACSLAVPPPMITLDVCRQLTPLALL